MSYIILYKILLIILYNIYYKMIKMNINSKIFLWSNNIIVSKIIYTYIYIYTNKKYIKYI